MILPLEWLGPHFQKLCWILIGTYQRSPKCFECSLTSLDHKLKDNINKVSNRIDDSNIECNSTLFCFYWTATGYLHQKDKKKVCSLFKSPSHIVTSIRIHKQWTILSLLLLRIWSSYSNFDFILRFSKGNFW